MCRNSELEQQVTIERTRQYIEATQQKKPGRKRKLWQHYVPDVPNADGYLHLLDEEAGKQSEADSHTAHGEQDASTCASQGTEARPLKRLRLDSDHGAEALTVGVQDDVDDNAATESCEPDPGRRKSKGRKRG